MMRDDDLIVAAQRLHHLAEWAAVFGLALEPRCRRPNDEADPANRTVTFDAAELDHFLNGFRQLPVELEQIATQLDHRLVQHSLRVVAGGRG